MNKKTFFLSTLICFLAILGFSQISDAVNFFAYNMCGTGQTVSWRGNCHTGDNPAGGYHDAGDHVKFNLPMAFSAATLAWADYEYGASVSTPVTRILSYLKVCGASPVIYQVGDGGADHAYWGPPENQTGTRPSYSTTQASAVQAGTAAAFAIAAVAGISGGDITFAKTCYAAAEAAKSDAGYTAANGFYTSGGFYDELIWAAIWIYLGTNDATYLAKAEQYFSNLNADYQWTHCWDDSRYGAILKLAQITGKQVYISWIEKYLDFWMKGGGLAYTPGGLPYLQNWGPIRYACATAMIAKIWSQSVYCTASKVSTYSSFATSIVNYAKGTNPRNSSYIIGYGTNWPKCPHHRAADPNKNCGSEALGHRLTGGLVGGPDANDSYVDDVNQYQYTEVAMDYNACLVAALAAIGGGQPPTYPTPTPTPEPGPTANPGSGDGLLGEYYSGTNFGTLLVSRIDPNVNFNWAGGSPDASISADNFTVRWTGQVEAVYTDTYMFYENTDDGCRVYVDNRLVIDKWEDGAAAENASSAVSLTAGTKYTIKVEFYESAGDASAVLSWASNYQAKEVIPKTRLYSGASVTPVPTATPTAVPTAAPTAVPTAAPTAVPTATPDITPAPTAVPTATPAPDITPAPTAIPTAAPTATPAPDITPEPLTGCTCDTGCSSSTAITAPFTKDGAGELCFTASSLGAYINSWNIDLLEINGVNVTNLYVPAGNLPAKINNLYYVYYKGSFAWSHFEAK